jgi:hypothetical protein
MEKKKLDQLKEEIKEYKNCHTGSEKKRFDELEHIEEYWKDVDSGLAESLIFLVKEVMELRSIVNRHREDIDSLYGLEH